MSNDPLVKDVENLLLNKQKCSRRQGELPYPIIYSKNLADFDIWDHMFRISYCKNLTMHQFAEPPALILDLGCGSGLWAVDAAKQWKNSTIIGFDIAKIQPRLSSIGHVSPLSHRINWVHGNLFDGLPFPPNHFDFVRMVGMGLAIPEDEWQSVLEDVYRVLKPGAVLEIIEEDLLFPSPSAQLQSPKSQASTPLTESPVLPQGPQQVRLQKKRSTLFSDRSNSSSERTRVSPASSASSIAETKSNSKITNLLPLFYNLRQSSTATLTPTPSTCTELEIEHPQDHTRVKTAWDAMLTTRFLSPNLLSVLPFYLTSASFSVKVHPPILVPLPPNPGAGPLLRSFQSMGSLRHPDRSGGVMFDFQPALSNRSIKTDGFSLRTSLSAGSRPQPAPWGSMHLAKATSVVKACRQAIWVEYKKLYEPDALDILARTAPLEELPLEPEDYLIHRAFEVDWDNWL
ncbi:S-adenosyl-L-methionine-dependent methyltransferase [Phlegmacium glaucopus]|nr:S-adenosyl-L-methionine-dependent methyltransferase [Phlegmacium glaucopus]